MGCAVMALCVYGNGEVGLEPLVTLDEHPPGYLERVDLAGVRHILGLRAFSASRAWYEEGYCGPVEIHA
jgi:hypothetical protein